MPKLLLNILVILLISGIRDFSYGQNQKYKDMARHSTQVVLGGVYGPRKQIFEQNVKSFLDGINQAYLTNTRPSFSSKMSANNLNIRIGDLWSVSPFLSVRPNIIENLLATSQGNYEVRNLQIIIEEAQEDYKQQDGVIIFDREGKIIDFKIALGYNRVFPILTDTVSVTDFRRREIIIGFVEDFRTAYVIKDTTFLNKVFSDKALIITGKIIRQTEESENKPKVEYTKQTKTQYLKNLKIIFNRAKILNIHFKDIKVVRHPTLPKLYGVRLIQDWNSELITGGKYHDEGYVFLVIDFSNESIPKIWVRTWALEDFFSFNSFIFN